MSALVDTALYNALPSLEEAHIHRQAPIVDGMLNGPLRDLFLEHPEYCVYLCHAHHNLEAGEALVKVDGTGHVMNNAAMANIQAFGSELRPTTWMPNGNGDVAVELGLVDRGSVTPVSPSDTFLAEFDSILQAHGCKGLFGIDSVAERDWIEMGIGGASVVVPHLGDEGFDGERFVPVAFSFDKVAPGYRVHGRCGTDHKHTKKPGQK